MQLNKTNVSNTLTHFIISTLGIRIVSPLIELDLFIIKLSFKSRLRGLVKRAWPLKMEQEKRWVPL